MSFVYVLISDTNEIMMSSNFLVANSEATYTRYIRVAKMIINNKGVLALLLNLFMDVPVVKTLSNTHLDDPSLYISTKKDILLMIQATNSFLKTTTIPIYSTLTLSSVMLGLILKNINFAI